MKKFTHVMIDLETLGTNPDCVILSLGAVEFDPATGEQGREYYEVIDRGSQQHLGRTEDSSTLAWWDRQSPEARKVLTAPGKAISSVLMDFKAWLPPSCKPWAKGPTFDIAI